MRRLNEVMDLKFSLLIFRQFHGAITRSQKKCLRTFVRQCLGNNFHERPLVFDCDLIKNTSSWSISSLPNSTLYVHSRSHCTL